jgi:drug/metabolite transporter (DMT)-like permease
MSSRSFSANNHPINGSGFFRWRGLAMALFCILVWGLSYPVTRASVQEIPPLTLAFGRFFLAACLVWPLTRRFPKRIARQDRIDVWSLGVAGATLYFGFENYGLKYTTASHGALIIATIPLLTEMVAAIRRGRRPPLRVFFGSFAALSGVAVLVGPGEDGASLLGDLLMFGAVAAWVGYSFLIERLAGRYPNLQLTQNILAIGAVSFFPGALAELFLNPIPWPSLDAWGGMVFLGVFCSALGYHFWNQAIPVLGVTATTNLLYILPLIGVAGGILILDEPLSAGVLVGGMMVLGGVCLASRRQKTAFQPIGPP